MVWSWASALHGVADAVADAVATTAMVLLGVVGAVAYAHEQSEGVKSFALFKIKQLVAVQTAPTKDHWLLRALYQTKRLQVQEAWAETLGEAPPTRFYKEIRTKCLKVMLSQLRRGLPLTEEGMEAWSGQLDQLVYLFNELLPQYEPLLLEVALVHCLHHWVSEPRAANVEDVEAFEAFLTAELRDKGAANWFGCQLIVDTFYVLLLSRHFYKEQIKDQGLRDLISIAIANSNGDAVQFATSLVGDLILPANKLAVDAWTAWLEEELADVGASRRSEKGASGLFALSGRMINPTHFSSEKRAYFPLGMELEGIDVNSFRDMSGVINAQILGCSNGRTGPGFIYVWK